jgi:hypothetical protein
MVLAMSVFIGSLKLHSRLVSSTNASPICSTVIMLFAEERNICGILGLRELYIIQKHNNQSNGPMVDPWPGPYSSLSIVFSYCSSDIPYIVFM